MLDEDDGVIKAEYQNKYKHQIFTITLNTCVHTQQKHYQKISKHVRTQRWNV